MNEWERIHALRKNSKLLEEIFFESMLSGYAKEKSGSAIRGSTERRSFKKGPWLVLDEWCTTQTSDASGGSTTMFFEGKRVWMMHYFGNYSHQAIPILKNALMDSYTNKIFNGGRGPSRFEDSNGVYSNHAENNSITSFRGREEIRIGRKLHGYHDYHGGIMA